MGVWIFRKNRFSKEAVKLEILGPSEIVAGQEFEFAVRYKNIRDFRLEDPELLIEFPSNSIIEDRFTETKTLKREQLGEAIYPGEEKVFIFKVKVLGREGETKTARASLTYRPKNIKAKYTSSTTFTAVIKNVPITFEIDLPLQIEAQKDFAFRLYYFSNLDSVLSNIRIQMDWPSDFEFVSAKPEAFDQKEWSIPVLNKFQGGKIEVTGRFHSEPGMSKILRARIGIIKEGQFVTIKEIEKGIELIKPLIYIREEINGNPEYIALPGDWLHYEIYFKNLKDELLQNLFLIVNLEGSAFDFDSVRADTGNYQKDERSIIFDWTKNPPLKLLEPLGEGKVEFWVRLKENIEEIDSPQVINHVTIGQARTSFITKISSKINFVQKGLYLDEVFGNSGPLPPEIGNSTTYTINWKIVAPHSSFDDVKVYSHLPNNVSLTGKFFPESESSKISFDPDSREFVWMVGQLEKNEERSIAFQISLTPQKDDKGKTPQLLSPPKVFGKDRWSSRVFEAEFSELTTFLKDDPSITLEKSIVK